MSVGLIVQDRSPCARRRVGAVIVDADNRIVATGYNGVPRGFSEPHDDCAQLCPRAMGTTPITDEYSSCVSIHAEANALLFCDMRDRLGGTLYVTSSICWDCAKLVANSGLRRVLMMVSPDDKHRQPQRSIDFMRECGLEVITWGSME